MAVPQKKVHIKLPHVPAIPLLSVYLKELKAGSQRDICTPMFIAALLNSQEVEQPKRLWMDGWMDG